jgi:hypothetical protein
MKKSQLKEIIKKILKEVQDNNVKQMGQPIPPPTQDDLDVDQHDADQDYKQQTNQFVREESEADKVENDPDYLPPEERRERDRAFASWKRSRGNDDSGYDLNDPKHPSYGERMADKADRAKDDAKYHGLDETKALSGMKEAPTKGDNTQMKSDDKSITSTAEPKEKKEGKKLPVVKKPAQPKKVNEVLAQLVKEVVDEYRVKGALGKNNPNRTAPIKNIGKNYKKVEPKAPVVSPDGTVEEPEEIDAGSGLTFTFVEPSGKKTDLDSDLPWYSPNQLNTYLEKEVMPYTGNLSVTLDPTVPQLLAKIAKEEIPYKDFLLKYDHQTKTVKMTATK